MSFGPKEFGLRVLEIRQSKGLSQQEMADVCGLHRTHISKIEQGNFRVQLDTLIQIAQGLRVSLSELFEGVELEDLWETRKAKRQGLH